jgi:hypothetical protein
VISMSFALGGSEMPPLRAGLRSALLRYAGPRFGLAGWEISERFWA